MASTPPPDDTWSRQLRKGILDLAILTHLSRHATHGYALIAALKREGLMPPEGAEATVYQALQRLAKKGLATAAWSDPDPEERPRKLYTLTPAGQRSLDAMHREWRSLAQALDELLQEAP